MNAPMMNKLQLCGAGESCTTHSAGAQPAARPRVQTQGTQRAAALVFGAAALAVAAAAWLALSRPALAPIVELERVVIVAQRLPPGTCPVPVEPADSTCPVPLQAQPADAAHPVIARRTQP